MYVLNTVSPTDGRADADHPRTSRRGGGVHGGKSPIWKWIAFYRCKGSHQGRMQEFVLGNRSPPHPSLPWSFFRSLTFPSFSDSFLLLLFPLEIGPLKQLESLGERCKLPKRGSERIPGRKRIWCTLKLRESHWWHFWVFYSACFTVERWKFSTS